MRLQINAWSLTNKVDIMNVNLFGAIKLEMLNLALYVLTLVYYAKALLITKSSIPNKLTKVKAE